MEDSSRQRRPSIGLQHHAHAHALASSRFANHPNGTTSSVRTMSENRFRSTPINTSTQTHRGHGNSASSLATPNSYGYYPESASAFSSTNLPSATMSATGYGSAEYSQDARQQQQQHQQQQSQTGSFAGYNTAAMMYNVAQTGGSQTSVYDAQNFAASRQPGAAALQMIASGPDVASSYFNTDAAANPSSSSLQSSPHHGAVSAAAVVGTGIYHHQGTTYSSAMSAVGAEQQQQHSATTSGGGVDVATAEGNGHGDGALEEKWLGYQRQLGTVFQDIISGSLDKASETLLSISGWLLSQVSDLGLTFDNAELHDGRIKLWNEFNHAWLALGNRQKELTEVPRQSSSSSSSKPLNQATLEKMGNELVRLCDSLERHGLVDYQYGVWEDQIIAVLEDCLDLLESNAST